MHLVQLINVETNYNELRQSSGEVILKLIFQFNFDSPKTYFRNLWIFLVLNPRGVFAIDHTIETLPTTIPTGSRTRRETDKLLFHVELKVNSYIRLKYIITMRTIGAYSF